MLEGKEDRKCDFIFENWSGDFPRFIPMLEVLAAGGKLPQDEMKLLVDYSKDLCKAEYFNYQKEPQPGTERPPKMLVEVMNESIHKFIRSYYRALRSRKYKKALKYYGGLYMAVGDYEKTMRFVSGMVRGSR